MCILGILVTRAEGARAGERLRVAWPCSRDCGLPPEDMEGRHQNCFSVTLMCTLLEGSTHIVC